MPKVDTCILPRVGKRIKEYNDDAALRLEAKKLSAGDILIFEAHLLSCSFCRKRLNLEAQLSLETTLILSGYFLEDPVLVKKRRETVSRFLQNRLPFEEFKRDWLGVSGEERRKLKAFMKEDC